MNGTDLSWIVGLVITVPLYYLLATRLATRSRPPHRRPRAPDAALTRPWLPVRPARRRTGNPA